MKGGEGDIKLERSREARSWKILYARLEHLDLIL